MTSPSASTLTRRTVLKGAAYSTAAVVGSTLLRGFDVAAAAAPAHQGVFGYGVASGDPTGGAVVIWTRATPPPETPDGPVAVPGSGLGAPLRVHWEVAYDRHFRHLVRHGTIDATAEHDHTVKVDVGGLAPYTRYWYRFRAAGETSPVGRTQTAPDEPRHPHREHALRFALVSCSNYTGGWFTAYRALGRRTDLDFVLHVGDYIYEFGNGSDRSGPAALVGKRDALPPTETIDLEGYRLRHALHKADPDLQLAHRNHPWITIFDDHEVANNTWARGAQNHTPGVEGDFLARRTAAYEAYLEWMPFRLPEQERVPHQGTRFFKRFRFGSLADLSVLETRQNRSAQVAGTPPGLPDGFVPLGSAALEEALADPDRHLPEPEQLSWLEDGLMRRDRRWHLVGNQVVFTPLRFPGAAFGLPSVPTLINADQWDGYRADQSALVAHLADLAGQPGSSGDAVFLTGDIHSSWVTDIPDTPGAGYTSVGVEVVCPSVTSDGFYELLGRSAPGAPAEALVAKVGQLTAVVRQTNPWVRYLDGVGHGFVVVDVTRRRVQADYHLTPVPTSEQPDPRVDATTEPTYATSWQTLHGSRQVSPADGPLGHRHDHPYERHRRH